MKIINEIFLDRDKQYMDNSIVMSSKNDWFALWEFNDKSSNCNIYDVQPLKVKYNWIKIGLHKDEFDDSSDKYISLTIQIDNKHQHLLDYMNLDFAKSVSDILNEAVEFAEEVINYLKKNNMWKGN